MRKIILTIEISDAKELTELELANFAENLKAYVDDIQDEDILSCDYQLELS